MTIDSLDFNGVSEALDGSSAEAARNINFGELVSRALSGQLDFSPSSILNTILNALLGETRALFSLTRDMVIIALISALFKALANDDKGGAAKDMGFYVNYLVVVAILISSLRLCFETMAGLAADVTNVVIAAQPLIVSLVVFSGGAARGALFSPVVFYACSAVAGIVNAVIVPMLSFAGVIRLVNYLSERDTLAKAADGITALVKTGLKIICAVFLAVLSVQRFAATAADGVLAKGGRAAASLVPVVGQSLAGAIDAASLFANAARGGVLTALLVAVFAVVITPLVRVGAFVVVYKLTAALIQPVCDERIVEAIDGAGKLAVVAFSVCALISGLCVMMTVIVLSFGY